MEHISFSGRFNHNSNTVNVGLSMYIFKEEDVFIVYCPALDMSAYGDTEQQAKKAFEDVLEESLKYMLNKSTLKQDLINHGWKLKSLKQKKIKAPSIEEMMKKNSSFRELINKKEYTTYKQTIGIPEIV